MFGEEENTPSRKEEKTAQTAAAEIRTAVSSSQLRRAWTPWVLLSAIVFLWGVPKVKTALNKISAPEVKVAYLHIAIAAQNEAIVG